MQEIENRSGLGQGTAAPGSPLARLRANYEAAQHADPARFVALGVSDLVAKVGRSEDVKVARNLIRVMGSISTDGGEEIEFTAEDLASIVAATTLSLHIGTAEEHEPILLDDGQELRFDAFYGMAIGVPEIATPVGAVLAAFTRGEPPVLDTLMLMMAASSIAAAVSTDEDRKLAESVVGEASALRT